MRSARSGQAPVRRAPVPDAPLDTEALKGERVTVYDENGEGWGWGQLHADGYVGWMPTNALRAPGPPPTHQVAALRTFLFPGPLHQGASRSKACRSGCRLAIERPRRRTGAARLRRLRAGAASRAARRRGTGFRRRRRALRRRALSVGRQDQPRHRLLGPGAGRAHRLRRRLPARQRHAGAGARGSRGRGRLDRPAARRSRVLEGPCRHRARRRDAASRQCIPHGGRRPSRCGEARRRGSAHPAARSSESSGFDRAARPVAVSGYLFRSTGRWTISAAVRCDDFE